MNPPVNSRNAGPDFSRAKGLSAKSRDRYHQLTSRLDDELLKTPSIAIYSDDLARRIGTSIRTLQIATRATRGLSLHRYIRLKRLWWVRLQLVNGQPERSVKAIALNSGFWHMGDFGRAYKRAFGEAPSATLARSLAIAVRSDGRQGTRSRSYGEC